VDSTFEIYFVVSEGEIVWMETATSPEEARQLVRQIGEKVPGDYVIIGRPSGTKTPILY
jgi:hypothetical protein